MQITHQATVPFNQCTCNTKCWEQQIRFTSGGSTKKGLEGQTIMKKDKCIYAPIHILRFCSRSQTAAGRAMRFLPLFVFNGTPKALWCCHNCHTAIYAFKNCVKLVAQIVVEASFWTTNTHRAAHPRHWAGPMQHAKIILWKYVNRALKWFQTQMPIP